MSVRCSPSRVAALVCLALLTLVRLAHAQEFSRTYDSSSGNVYARQRNADGSTDTFGCNMRTGSTWYEHQDHDGTQSGINKNGGLFLYDPRTGETRRSANGVAPIAPNDDPACDFTVRPKFAVPPTSEVGPDSEVRPKFAVPPTSEVPPTYKLGPTYEVGLNGPLSNIDKETLMKAFSESRAAGRAPVSNDTKQSDDAKREFERASGLAFCNSGYIDEHMTPLGCSAHDRK